MFDAASMLHVLPFLLSFKVNAGRGLLNKLLNLVTFIAIIFTSNIQIITISLAKGDGWVVVVDCNIALLQMVNIVTFIIFIISTSLS